MAKPKAVSSTASIRNLAVPQRGQIDHSDRQRPGLYVRVSASGTKSFVVFYRFNDKQRRDTIGRFSDTAKDAEVGSLSWARGEADRIRAQVRNGIDPRLEREEERRAANERRDDTYRASVEEYIGERESAGNLKTSGEIKRVLLKEGADWVDRPISSLTARDVRPLLIGIRDGSGDTKPRPYLANRTHAYLRTFFAWCAEPGVEKIDRSPMAGMKRPFSEEMPRDRIYSDKELKVLWGAADQVGGHAGAFLKLAMLAGKRKGALSSMRWDEISEESVWRPAGWVLPMARRGKTRNKRVHAIPLPGLAQRILAGVAHVAGNPHVFVGKRTGGHLDAGSPLQRKVKELSGVDDFDFHTFRRTVETGMADLRILPDLRDMILDHAPRRGAGADYDKHMYLKEMGEALEKWADHVASVVGGDNVAVLR